MPAGLLNNTIITRSIDRDHGERGYEYEVETQVTLSAGSIYYWSFELPPSMTSRYVNLQYRKFQANQAGVKLRILWDVASIAGGTPVDIFNSYDDLGRSSEVLVKAGVSVDLTGSRVREYDFLPAGSQQGNQSTPSPGLLDGETGFRIYTAAGRSHFVVELENTDAESNLVLLGYKFEEPPITLLG